MQTAEEAFEQLKERHRQHDIDYLTRQMLELSDDVDEMKMMVRMVLEEILSARIESAK